jgi:hypothetical protein
MGLERIMGCLSLLGFAAALAATKPIAAPAAGRVSFVSGALQTVDNL